VNASSFEIRQAYKNVLGIYEDSSLATYSLFTDDERQGILARIEKAFLTLIDDEKRLSYDNELANRGEISQEILQEREGQKAIPIFQINRVKTRGNNLARIRKKIQGKGAREITGAMFSRGFISGKDLKDLRQVLGIELEELFQATKISPATIRAIEQDDITSLPPTVYLKSFLKSYAEVLQLDANKVVAGYIKNIEKG
jgi:DnaJ-class molecular chaperone